MTLVELAELVAEMRKAQRAYFRSRTSIDLERSKGLERALDRVISDILEGPSLFAGEEDR